MCEKHTVVPVYCDSNWKTNLQDHLYVWIDLVERVEIVTIINSRIGVGLWSVMDRMPCNPKSDSMQHLTLKCSVWTLVNY